MNYVNCALLVVVLVLVVMCCMNKSNEGYKSKWNYETCDEIKRKRHCKKSNLSCLWNKTTRECDTKLFKKVNDRGFPYDLTDPQAESYLANYHDLKNAFGSNLKKEKSHWITYGKVEGPTWTPLNPTKLTTSNTTTKTPLELCQNAAFNSTYKTQWFTKEDLKREICNPRGGVYNTDLVDCKDYCSNL